MVEQARKSTPSLVGHSPIVSYSKTVSRSQDSIRSAKVTSRQHSKKSYSSTATHSVAFHIEGTRPAVSSIMQSLENTADDVANGDGDMDVCLPLFLPADWPTLEMRDPRDSRCSTSKSPRPRHSLRESLFGAKQKVSSNLTEDSMCGLCMHDLVFEPDATTHMFFDMLSIIFLLADLTLMPGVLAFEFPTSAPIEAFMWFAAFFWSLDLFVSFNTGYYLKGQLEMRRHVIAWSYLRGWFILDFGVVCCDWTLLVFLTEGTRTLKLMRLVKLGRAPLRMLRLVRVFEDLLDQYCSAGMAAIMRVLAMFLVALWLTHLLCCGWYGLGSYPNSDTGSTWLDKFTGADTADTLYMYTTSLHWSMAQLTLGAVEIVATNSVERCCSVCLLLLGLLFNSSLVSALSATFIRFQMLASGQLQEQMTLARFLRQHDVPRKLTMQVQRMAKLRIVRPNLLLEEDVSSLELLPASLISDLKCQIYKKTLFTHQFFSLICCLSPDLLPALSQTVRFANHVEGDELFLAGEKAEAVFFLSRGLMNYIQEPFTSPGVRFTETTEVEEHTWFCEAALWTQWIHVGRVVAVSSSQLTIVSVEDAVKALHKERVARDVSVAYGTQFHKCVCNAKPPSSFWPTDLFVPSSDFGDVVEQMDLDMEMRATIGVHAVRQSKHVKVNLSNQMKLYDEVLERKSQLRLTSDGEAHRIVHLLALHVVREDGYIFSQIGAVDVSNRQITPDCNLPVMKHTPLEDPSEVFARLLSTKLRALKDCVTLSEEDSLFDSFEAISKRFQVPTKYQRTVWNCDFRGELEVSTTVFTEEDKKLSHSTTTSQRTSLGQRTKDWSRRWSRHHPIPGIEQRDVFAFEYQGKTTLYTWLSATEFAKLRTGDQDWFLLKWISGLDPDPCTVADAVAREFEDEFIADPHQRETADEQEGGLCLPLTTNSIVAL